MKPIVYDYASFTITTGQSNYDLASNIAALFSNVTLAKNIVIIFDQNISVKFNSTLMPAISMTLDRSPFQSPVRFLEVKNIFITNSSGSTVNMEVLLW